MSLKGSLFICGLKHDFFPKFHYTQKVDFAQLKSEMQLVEKNDLALMKAENDRLMAEVDKLKQRLREEITRSQGGFRLDLNLEKGGVLLKNFTSCTYRFVASPRLVPSHRPNTR